MRGSPERALVGQPGVHPTIARLMMSAAVPCIGALIAARSAPARWAWLREWMSSRYSRRPNTVST